MNELKDFPIGTKIRIKHNGKPGTVWSYPNVIFSDSDTEPFVAIHTDFSEVETKLDCVPISGIEYLGEHLGGLDFT